MTASQFLLNSVLEERFGLGDFRPKQSEVIESVMAGNHTLALLPTGYGKSLCYQVPSQILNGVTIVVSPLIALMQDQLSALYKRGIRSATSLNSSIDSGELDERLRSVANGEIKLLYMAPERFESSRFRKVLAGLDISLVVIDEAHCISQWGHDFRLQYRNLSTHLAQISKATVLALTATATPYVQRDIVQTLALRRMKIISANFDRPNLRFEVKSLRGPGEKDEQLLASLEGIHGRDSTIVYTSSRKEAERTCDFLNAKGISAGFYHAGLQGGARQRTQADFQRGRFRVIVSTVAFGMGIDKADIGQVIHYNLPSSLESYYQEAGRAGRDGNPACCTLLYQPKDISTQKWLISKNYPSEAELFQIFQLIRSKGMNSTRLQELVTATGISENALSSGLGYLKQSQLIDATADGAFFDRSSTGDRIDYKSLEERKKKDLDRLQSIVNYASSTKCRRETILDYFGQALQNDCSGCDICH